MRKHSAVVLSALIVSLLPIQSLGRSGVPKFIQDNISADLAAGTSPYLEKGFSDVSKTTQYSEAIESLKERKVVRGYEDGTFKPKSTINRAEFLKIILESRSSETFTGSDCFPDVDDEWYSKYVCTAKDEGIIGGYPDGTFKPEKEINFAEASKIVALAFKQEINEATGQWYTGFVRALGGSNAIPTSINGLEAKITRGEMAEIMWRLTEEKTDQPSKSYMNVKYPNMKLDVSSNDIQKAESCEDLLAFAEESGTSQFGGGMIMEDAMAVPMLATRAQSGGASEKTATYSQTNVQVVGVDEADIVKTDGTYLYLVRNGKIVIVKAQPGDDLEIVSTIDSDEKVNFSVNELYIDGDRLIALGNSYNQGPFHIMEKRAMIAPGGYYPQTIQRTEVRIYDVSDASNPRLERKVSFEGNKISSRRINDKLYLVLNKGFNWWGPIPLKATEEDLMPKFSDSASGIEDAPIGRCGTVTVLPRVPHPQYIIVAVIPTKNTNEKVTKESILGQGTNVYSSLENLYIAGTRWNYYWRGGRGNSTEQTDIYKFEMNDAGVSFAAQGTVPGRILNQFSMDEHTTSFRIATTVGNSWDQTNPSANNLYVLNKDMEIVGGIEDIAPGERIYSVRFMGDRTYMVTFKKVDPFFVIDTSDPRNPKILGKLKIPGYSDYLHPYDENHIIGFGKEAIEAKEGDFAWYQGMKVAIFDVTDVKNPKEKHKLTIGDRGTQSPLLYNHKALLFEKDRNLLAFPVQISEITEEQKKNNPDGTAWGTPVFQGANVYKLTLKDGFQLVGQISHYTEEDNLKSGQYMYGKNIDRVLRINDSILSVSQGGVQSHSLWNIDKEGEVEFPDFKDTIYQDFEIMPIR